MAIVSVILQAWVHTWPMFYNPDRPDSLETELVGQWTDQFRLATLTSADILKSRS